MSAGAAEASCDLLFRKCALEFGAGLVKDRSGDDHFTGEIEQRVELGSFDAVKLAMASSLYRIRRQRLGRRIRYSCAQRAFLYDTRRNTSARTDLPETAQQTCNGMFAKVGDFLSANSRSQCIEAD